MADASVPPKATTKVVWDSERARRVREALSILGPTSPLFDRDDMRAAVDEIDRLATDVFDALENVAPGAVDSERERWEKGLTPDLGYICRIVADVVRDREQQIESLRSSVAAGSEAVTDAPEPDRLTDPRGSLGNAVKAYGDACYELGGFGTKPKGTEGDARAAYLVAKNRLVAALRTKSAGRVEDDPTHLRCSKCLSYACPTPEDCT